MPALTRQLSSEGTRLFAESLHDPSDPANELEYERVHAELVSLQGTGPQNKPQRQRLKQRLHQLNPVGPSHYASKPASQTPPHTCKSIIFVRHGQSTAQAAGRQRKQPEYLDAPLTKLGERQAAALAHMPFCDPTIAGESTAETDVQRRAPWPELVVVSPLTRALQVRPYIAHESVICVFIKYPCCGSAWFNIISHSSF
jgi:hypothetical protein